MSLAGWDSQAGATSSSPSGSCFSPIFHEGKEICIKFQSNQCFFPKYQWAHICKICKQSYLLPSMVLRHSPFNVHNFEFSISWNIWIMNVVPSCLMVSTGVLHRVCQHKEVCHVRQLEISGHILEVVTDYLTSEVPFGRKATCLFSCHFQKIESSGIGIVFKKPSLPVM